MERSAVQWLATALAAGCVHRGGADAVPEPSRHSGDPAFYETAEMKADLARLAALDVVTIGGVDLGAFDTHCYGLCPEAVEGMRATQGPRLHALAEVAERASKDPLPCEGLDEAGEYAALAGLGIVWIAAREPDASRSEAEDCRRLGSLAAINRAAKDL